MTDALPIQVIPEADFDRDGTYETDLSDYFNLRAGGLSIGRGAARQGNIGVGTLSLNLDNFDGTFTTDYSSSSLYGQLEPHVPVRIRCVLDSTEYVLFTGYVSRYRPKFGRPGENRCLIEAKDLMAHLEGFPSVNVSVDTRTTDEAIRAVAEAAGLTEDDLDLEFGAQTLTWHWCRNAIALAAMQQVMKSEMGGEVYTNAAGQIRFLGRNTRVGVAEVAQAWGYGTDIIPESIDPELTDDDLISEASVQPSILVEDDPDVQIFALESPIPVTAGVPIYLEFDFPMPVESLDTSPVSTDDYLQNSAEDGSGTDQTSDLTVTITDLGAGFGILLLSSSTGYVTKLNLFALPLNPSTTRPVFKHSLPIAGQKMAQGVSLDIPYAEDTQQVRDYPVPICRTYRYPYPFVKLNFAWDTDAIAAAMLEVELWDLVSFDDTGPGGQEWLTNIVDWFYVVGLRHQLTPGQVFRTEATLVPANLYFDLDAVTYDDFARDDASGDLGTSLSADTWADDSGFDIASGAARANTDTESVANVLLFESEDQVVEVQLSEIGAGDEVGVAFRYEGAGHHSRVYLDAGSNEVILEHVIGGVVTEISSPAYTVGTSAELKVTVQEHRVRVWVDRRLVIDAEDLTGWLAQRVGLFARNASGTTKFSNFHGRAI